MAEKCKDLPEECWELIINRIPQPTHLEPLSLVCKQFLFLTNRLRSKLSVIDPTLVIHGRISKLVNRFSHLKSIDFSGFRGNLNVVLLDVAGSCLLGLEEIDISNTNCVPIRGLSELGSKLRCLRVLNCSRVGILRDNDLVVIANSFPCLEELDVSYPRKDLYLTCAARSVGASMMTVTDGGMKVLAMSLKNLRKINVSGNHFITDRSLVCLSVNCPALEGVAVKDCTLITSNGVLFLLHTSVNLSSVSVSNVEIRGRRLEVEDLVGFGQGLRTLELSNSILSDELLCLLWKANPPLKKLCILDCVHFSFSMLSSLLSSLQSLQYLALCRVDFLTDDCIEWLSRNLNNLVGIKLNGCSNLTSSTFYTLAKGCPSLEDIEMECTNLGKEDYIVEPVKRVNILSLNLARNQYLSDACAKSFALVCPNLETLDLSSCSCLTEEGISEVLDICQKIKHLRMADSSLITTIGKGSELPKLEVLNAVNTAINDEGLATIGKRCPRLLKLELESCGGVTTRGVEEVLRQCNTLREINLKHCRNVDDRILDWMVFSRPSLGKIIPPCYSSLTENQKRLYLHHGCQVCEG